MVGFRSFNDRLTIKDCWIRIVQRSLNDSKKGSIDSNRYTGPKKGSLTIVQRSFNDHKNGSLKTIVQLS